MNNRYFPSLRFLLITILIIFCAHHLMIYVHEWIHGTVAWLGGYKTTPFDIHYGEKWITLLDIDEMVDYPQLLAKGKNGLSAAIAITPTLVGMILFLFGLWLLHNHSIQRKKWIFSFCYWFTLFELSEVYAYIPIRTFAKYGDIYNFLLAMNLSPWTVFIPGTLFVIWGIYHFLSLEAPRASKVLNIPSKSGRFFFLFATLIFFFGYWGELDSYNLITYPMFSVGYHGH